MFELAYGLLPGAASDHRANEVGVGDPSRFGPILGELFASTLESPFVVTGEGDRRFDIV